MPRIAHIADVHFGREDTVALAAAEVVLAREKPDLLVVGGDLTQRGKRSEFQASKDWLSQFKMPMLVVAGNHDTPLLNMAARVTEPFARFDKYFGSKKHLARADGVAVTGLNTSRGWQMRRNWAEGSVDLEQLQNALTRIGHIPGEAHILACHHPFLSPPGAPLRISTRRGASASRLVAASSVSIVLTGHVHTPSAVWRHERVGRYLALTCGTLSTRVRNVPPSFSLIDLDGEHVRVETHTLHGDTMQAETLPLQTI